MVDDSRAVGEAVWLPGGSVGSVVGALLGALDGVLLGLDLVGFTDGEKVCPRVVGVYVVGAFEGAADCGRPSEGVP